ncbi:MAG: hypothetical protein IKM02_05850 [Clostridia bacterium]|nr:hypothetical protein [Clostridia bacterium]
MKLFRRVFMTILIAALCLAPAASAMSYAPLTLSEDERYAMNLFLSNFTEVGCDNIGSYSADTDLVDFAHDHMWFNDNDAYEYGEYSEYPDDGGNNCRVSDERIQEIVDKYFLDPPVVDLSQTRFNYDGEYYYHCETGGWSNSGFAQTVSVCPIGDNQYFAAFMTFGGGEFWDNNVLELSIDESSETFGAPQDFGHAIIYASDLSDRSTYKMVSYFR